MAQPVLFSLPARSARHIFLEGLAQGRLLYQHDEVARRAVFPPREVGPSGRPEALAWRQSAGQGNVHSFTVLHKPAGNIVLVDLDEGFRLMSTVTGIEAAQLQIGLRVCARIEPHDDAHRIVFEVLA
jgi:uncharacterized protein